MKTMRFSSLQLAVAALGLSVCSLATSAQSTTPVLTAYYGVKNALAATDAAKAKTQAAILSAALSNVNTAKLSAADKKTLTMAKNKAAALSKTSDVAAQREQFDGLSTSMIALMKTTKPAKTYVQFCPMAAEGRGASWLSDKREVRNPYYGDKMLNCGSVREEI